MVKRRNKSTDRSQDASEQAPAAAAAPTTGEGSTAVAAAAATPALSTTQKLLGIVPFPAAVLSLGMFLMHMAGLAYAISNAFRIRLHALDEYGFVIHEFDPWFNFRATQYLLKHGPYKFFHWFDYKSWYPLGRPVGSTIYPGMQFVSVAIYKVLKLVGRPLSLNKVCCYIPCWGGAAATFFMFLLTEEATGSRTAGVAAAIVMAVIPAHTMRSVGGGYDNESVAMTALVMTFYWWIRSLRTHSSWPLGIMAGLSYAFMVAAWGGYVFVLNMLALHAAVICVLDQLRGKYSSRVWKSYSLMYVIGTAIAVQIPVVGMTPFKSLEQLSALLVFVFLQVLQLSESMRRKYGAPVVSLRAVWIRVQYFVVAAAILAAIAAALAPTGFFGPISARVRGLFVKHTRTGNPLVDSVAEHQPASPDAYWHYMHYGYYGWALGAMLLPPIAAQKRFYASTFLVLYAVVTYYFANRMARLVLLAAPVAAGMSGFCIGYPLEYAVWQLLWSEKDASGQLENKKPQPGSFSQSDLGRTLRSAYAKARLPRVLIAIGIFGAAFFAKPYWLEFWEHSEQMARNFAHPQLMFKVQYHDGRPAIIDDYFKAYQWLKSNTPKDARVMAWWDYGYQITGIGERTSIADGNTWNHEHIATLGYCLTSPVPKAHRLIRHLADYVLIWAGQRGDDLGKSPHMARIGNSVYRDICPNDPLCSQFGFYSQGYENPTPMMKDSLLYNLHQNGQKGIKVDSNLFQEVHTTRHGLVKIFKVVNVSEESRAWVADPANRKCDESGWICPGQYPPAEPIQKLLKRRRDFGQLEDFNRKKADKEYTKEYMKRFGGGAE